MTEAEVYSALQSNRSKRRWARVRAEQQSGSLPPMPGAPAQVVMPRRQETRTTQVFGPPPFPDDKPPRQRDIWKRVQRRMKEEAESRPGGYWNRKQLQYAFTLEEFAKDFAAAGRIKEATQIHLVLYGKTKEFSLGGRPIDRAGDICRRYCPNGGGSRRNER